MSIGEFTQLKIIRQNDNGFILYWDVTQNLLLPWEEKVGEISIGDEVVVFITEDEQKIPMASMRLRDFLNGNPTQLMSNQQVELLVVGESPLGFECIIDQKYLGILYHNEVFQALSYGSKLTGFVKKVRDDGKVDLMSQLQGTRGTPRLSQKILDRLETADGFLALNDKSDPGDIHDAFGVSKKKFKIALGALYKKRLITIAGDGIRLLDSK